MNFFKSVFSDDPEDDPATQKPESNSPTKPDSPINPSSQWSFGGLMKTIQSRSESVIDTYSRDLKEFGSGLKKEIQVAQGSLTNVTHVIDEFGNTVIKGTAQIISHGKDAILAVDSESDSSDSSSYSKRNDGYVGNLDRKYSRFDAQLRVIRGDAGTYCEDPYDLDDYKEWKDGFVLDDERKREIGRLVEENPDVGGMFKRFVPASVDYESFWCRYFYKVFKLKQAEDMRAKIVKRAISREEEELSWDVDDSDEDEEERGSGVGLGIERGEGSEVGGGGDGGKKAEEVSEVEELKTRDGEDGGKEVVDKRSRAGRDDDGKEADVPVKTDNMVQNEETGKKEGKGVGEEGSTGKSHVDKAEVVHGEEEKISGSGNIIKESVAESSSAEVSEEEVLKRGDSGLEKKELDSKHEKKVPVVQGKADDEEPRQDSDVSVVSSQPSQPEEEDLGWDEIEDLSSIDDKRATEISSPKGAELRKRLSAAEEEEDLSWDIEDDD